MKRRSGASRRSGTAWLTRVKWSGPSAPAGWRDGELPADRSRGTDRDLAVARERRAEVTRAELCQIAWFAPSRKTSQPWFVRVAFEVSTPQGAARSIVIFSACPPPMGGSRP